jgi:hypothetical protein
MRAFSLLEVDRQATLVSGRDQAGNLAKHGQRKFAYDEMHVVLILFGGPEEVIPTRQHKPERC